MSYMSKQVLIFVLCMPFYFNVAGQHITYYDAKGKEVNSMRKAETYVVLEKSAGSNGEEKANEKEYYKTGQLLDEKNYSSYDDNTLDGIEKKWFTNNKIKAIIRYNNDTLVDSLVTYWQNGKYRRRDNYDAHGKLISGVCYDSNGNTINHFDYKKEPLFTYNKGDFDRYFLGHIKYPQYASRSGNGGRFIVSFFINTDGTMSNVTILKSTGDRDLDDAALDVFTGNDIPLWTPATEDGEAVRVRYTYTAKFEARW